MYYVLPGREGGDSATSLGIGTVTGAAYYYGCKSALEGVELGAGGCHLPLLFYHQLVWQEIYIERVIL